MIKHTPYANRSGPFEIGLTPLDLEHWIEVDDKFSFYLAEKKRLIGEMPQCVFAADRSSEVAQDEVAELLIGHLLEYFPNTYSRIGNHIEIKGVEEAVDLDDFSMPPLLNAAMLVQEDLVIMRREADGWRFVAGSVCFPSSWILHEKIGRLMHEVHTPVPQYSKGTRNAGMIERIFDNLHVDVPVERFNWSIYNSDGLYQRGHHNEHAIDKAGKENTYYLRVEHQTLRKLPKTQDILFTIRIHVDPINMLAKRKDKGEIASKFIATIEAMTDEQVRYKGIVESRDLLIERLRELAT